LALDKVQASNMTKYTLTILNTITYPTIQTVSILIG